MTVSRRLAKMMLSGVFIVSGTSAFEDPKPLVERADKVVPRLREVVGIETETANFVRANGALQATSAVAMAADVMPRLSATALLMSLIPTTIAGHRFWEADDPDARIAERTQALKNLAIAAGLLMVIFEPRRHSRHSHHHRAPLTGLRSRLARMVPGRGVA